MISHTDNKICFFFDSQHKILKIYQNIITGDISVMHYLAKVKGK